MAAPTLQPNPRCLPSCHGQALVGQWLSWQVGELNPLWGYAVNALLRRNPVYNDEARIADSIGKWAERLAVLEGRLQKSPFVAGNAFGVADIATALSSHRWFSTPIENGPRWRTAQTP